MEQCNSENFKTKMTRRKESIRAIVTGTDTGICTSGEYCGTVTQFELQTRVVQIDTPLTPASLSCIPIQYPGVARCCQQRMGMRAEETSDLPYIL